MEIHFSPDQEARLAQIASVKGRNADELVQELLDRYLEQDARFRAGVRKGIEQADRGEFIEEEEMDNRI